MRLAFVAAALAALVVPALAQTAPSYPSSPLTADEVFRIMGQRWTTCLPISASKIRHPVTKTMHCIYDGYPEALQAVGYQAVDLEQERVAAMFVLAEDIDAKRLTPAQERLRVAQFTAHLNTEYQARAAAIEQQVAEQQAAAQRQQQADATEQVATELAQAEARIEEERIEAARLRAATQLLTPQASDPWPAWAQPPAPPVNTQCRVFNGVMNCTSQ